MATIIRGLLAQDLPWGLVFAGMAIAVVIELCGVKSLSFAVGLYLPLSTTMPIAIGGALRGFMDRKKGGHDESEISSGMLYATGLVAGGALTGVLIAGLQGVRTAPGRSLAADILDKVGVHGWERFGATADIIGLVMFAGLSYLLLRAARQKLD
jgi:hypothetical protein